MHTDADAMECTSAPAKHGTKRKTASDADGSNKRVNFGHETLCALEQTWKYHPIREEIRVIYGPANKIKAQPSHAWMENPFRCVFITVFAPDKMTSKLIRIAEENKMPAMLAQGSPVLLPRGIIQIIADYHAGQVELLSHFSGWSGSVLRTFDMTGLSPEDSELAEGRCIECPHKDDTRIRNCVRGSHVCNLAAWNAPV